MKAIIEFDLPDDNEYYEMHNNVLNYYSFISQMNEWLRAEIKYNTNRTEKELKILQEVREMYFEKLNDNDIKL